MTPITSPTDQQDADARHQAARVSLALEVNETSLATVEHDFVELPQCLEETANILGQIRLAVVGWKPAAETRVEKGAIGPAGRVHAVDENDIAAVERQSHGLARLVTGRVEGVGGAEKLVEVVLIADCMGG